MLDEKEVLYAITRDISEKKALQLEISERNVQLNASNAHLEETIENLKQTQDKLVESEKMASLGSLVAGVAHEINTPVGIGLTGVSQLVEECNGISQRYQDGTLTENDFEDFIHSAKEIAGIVEKNLERTAHLVRSFKQVAVDQTSEEDRQVNIKHYFEEVVFSLASVLRKASAKVTIECAEDVFVLTNPGLLSQVLTNLIVNSVNHGFKERETGNIHIAVSSVGEKELMLNYKDDGKGISKEHISKIFDPFFTTQRGAGGTGLGLNITYNIITNVLGGSIVCHSEEGKGVEFIIKFKVADRLS
jgi:signal transduction histidine kinase